MRSLFAVALTAAFLMALPDDSEAKFVCGDFGDGYTCKFVPGGAVGGPTGQYKGPPVAPKQGSSEAAPVPYPSEPPPPADSGWSTNTSQPPPPSAAGKTCPPNTELLGGNCVPYTARCAALAANALPQPCAGVEEKQVCKPRADGLKDCCCITYSKF